MTDKQQITANNFPCAEQFCLPTYYLFILLTVRKFQLLFKF